jgi:putative endonuclease
MFVYIIQSLATGRYYVGSTADLSRRLYEHKNPALNPSQWARSRGPWELVFSREFSSPTEALRAGRYIKRMKSKTFIKRLVGGERELDAFAEESKRSSASRSLETPNRRP